MHQNIKMILEIYRDGFEQSKIGETPFGESSTPVDAGSTLEDESARKKGKMWTKKLLENSPGLIKKILIDSRCSIMQDFCLIKCGKISNDRRLNIWFIFAVPLIYIYNKFVTFIF